MNNTNVKKLMEGDYGKVLRNQFLSYSAPITLHRKGDNSILNNATVGFVKFSKDSKIFAITAYHVYQKLDEEDLECAISGIAFDMKSNFHDGDNATDIAIFNISEALITRVKKVVVEIDTKDWPPVSPQEGRGLFFCGFPGCERIASSDDKSINFGAFVCFGTVNDNTKNKLTIHLDEKHLVNKTDAPPDDYDFGGVSGAPVFASYNTESGVQYFVFVGIVSEYYMSCRLFVIAPAKFIDKSGCISHEDTKNLL